MLVVTTSSIDGHDLCAFLFIGFINCFAVVWVFNICGIVWVLIAIMRIGVGYMHDDW